MYQPKHRAEVEPELDMCTVCTKRPCFDQKSPGIGGALCLVCYYDL